MPNITNHNEKSVLTLLRSLVPRRDLALWESYRIAELQANRLLRYFDVQTTAVPSEIVSELPRIRIEREHSLPVSGAAHWNGRYGRTRSHRRDRAPPSAGWRATSAR